MDMFESGPSLVVSLSLGLIGMAYFSYGKRLQKTMPRACGIGLMVFPYFVSDMTWLVLLGCVLGVVPWLVRG